MKVMQGIPGDPGTRANNEKRWRMAGIVECRKERALLLKSGSTEQDPVIQHLDEVMADLEAQIAAKFPASRGLQSG